MRKTFYFIFFFPKSVDPGSIEKLLPGSPLRNLKFRFRKPKPFISSNIPVVIRASDPDLFGAINYHTQLNSRNFKLSGFQG